MRYSLFCRFLWQGTGRKFHSTSRRLVLQNERDSSEFMSSNLEAELKKELEAEESDAICIYRVPIHMRDVEKKAYSPNIISIGPYHHGEDGLQEMENLKWKFFHRLLNSSRANGIELNPVIGAMKELEDKARSCYGGKIEQSSDSFVKMMAIDGCFIVELFRELKQHNFRYAPSVARWMLPTLRRDLIMLENQLPLFVVQKLFELTNHPEESSSSLQDLVLSFFNPLLRRDSSNSGLQGKGMEFMEKRHFLDLFLASIFPSCSSVVEEIDKSSDSSNSPTQETIHGETSDTMRSVTALTKAGIKIKKAENLPILDVQLKGRALQIPPLYIDDYKGTLSRNMVAFEQCHRECRPDVISFLFFFDGLINSADDVKLLHYKGVIQHSLGNNKEVARIVNSLCKEISRDSDQSYLRKVEYDANHYVNTQYAKIRAKLVYHYFSSWVVGISTLAGLIALYLTLLQTGHGALETEAPVTIPDHLHATFVKPFRLINFKFVGLFDFTSDKPEPLGDEHVVVFFTDWLNYFFTELMF